MTPSSSQRLALVVLAAGRARRFGRPKQLVPVGLHGETLLEYAAYDCARTGFERVVVVVRPEEEEAFRRRLDGGLGRRVDLKYAHQPSDGLEVTGGSTREKPWGTAHALLAAEHHLEGAFAVVNADDFYGRLSFVRVAEALKAARRASDWFAVGFPVEQTLSEAGPVSRAVLQHGSAGELEAIVEWEGIVQSKGQITGRPAADEVEQLPPQTLVSMNLWGFSMEVFAWLRQGFGEFLSAHGESTVAEFQLPTEIARANAAGEARVTVVSTPERWCGLTFAEDEEGVRQAIARRIDSGEYPPDLWR